MSKKSSRILLLIALWGVPVSAQIRGPRELANAPVPGDAFRISYGSDSLQFGELRVPARAGPHPVVIVVHGGCWLAQLGNRDPRIVGLDYMRPLAAALAETGIATWNIEYRRLGNGGDWPTMFHDIASATDFLRTLASEHHLDLERVIAVGHSSGGHLAMWLAARPRLPSNGDLYAPDPLNLIGVANLDGPPDLRRFLPLQERGCGRTVITELLGGSPDEQPERYREASPAELLPLGIRQQLFAGRLLAEQAEAYAALATGAGDRAEVIVDNGDRVPPGLPPDANHFAFVDPESYLWPKVLQTIRRLVTPD